MENYINGLGQNAKAASRLLAKLSSQVKNDGLVAMADALINNMDLILFENNKDMEAGKEKGLTQSLLDRLLLDADRVKGMADGLMELVALPDPIGETISMWRRPNGLEIGKRRVPLGVIGMIYEARPNVTVDASGLAFKTGNAIILKGGSEAYNSNVVLVKILRDALVKMDIAADAIQLVESREREAVGYLLKMKEYLDVVIPRGGAGLINFVVNNSSVPSIQTGVGNCHVYVDDKADLQMAVNIAFNGKTHRPAVCNAVESLLVHKDIAPDFLPMMARKMAEKNVELHGCEETCKLVPFAVPATDEDWGREYLDLMLAVKVLDSIDGAIDHIANYGTGHSEAIVTNDYNNARRFQDEVDAAAVYVNASTRFTDGSEFGFGAEIGISTQKLHARGPMGLEVLTSTKYVINGNGQIR